MIGLAVLGIVFLFFVLVAYFCAQTWKVGQVIAVVALFLFTLVFFVLAAATLRTHGRWRSAYQQEQVELETARQRNRQLLYGDAADERDQTSLRGVTSLADRELMDRGRIWRNLRLAQVGPEGIVLSTVGWTNDNCVRVGQELSDDEIPEPVPDQELAIDEPATQDGPGAEADAGDAAPAPLDGQAAHGIAENSFVYAFKEFPIIGLTPAEKQYFFADVPAEEGNFADQDKRGMCRVPLVYMGKFRVAQANEQAVALAAMAPLDEAQRQMLAPRSPGTWVLYEKLPPDSHEVFAGLDPQQLATLFPPPRMQQLLGIDLPQPRYQEMLERYVRDSQDAQPDDPPQDTWLELKFTQPHVVPVDLEVDELPPADRPFTPDGRAQTPLLTQEAPSVFNKQGDAPGADAGDTALLDFATASQLVREGKADVIRPVFRRSLRDYQDFFDAAHADLLRVSDESNVTRRDLAALGTAIEQLNTQSEKYQNERDRLNQDLASYQQELDLLGRYYQALRDRYDGIRQQVNRLYLSAASQPSPLTGQ